ncbi:MULTISPECIES: flagellar assembly protein A [unclassified Duganella]|uniref:flagellar assembly protein A n=1 Tax=unclassified Duganella TaxID=2636909 RepID=UPI001E56163E|nr:MULTISPECIES: flagellar assembly protein A [unclassified Duganella]
MSDDATALEQNAEGDLPAAIVRRGDGIYFSTDAAAVGCLAAVSQVFMSSAYFAGLDYAVFSKVLYNVGPDLPENLRNKPLLRFADSIEPFHAPRRSLYKNVKIINGEAEYYFEPVFFEVPDMPPQPARLNFDEFVADMWIKGIRFGIDAPAVRDVIGTGRLARIVVARRLNATPGKDASIAEVSQDLHRSNAPLQKADGKLDWQTFQNRFPQVKPNVKLLRKVPRTPGVRGYELSGLVLEPPVPKDIELTTVAGEGTVIESLKDGEYLVSAVEGFLSLDPGTKRLSIGPKIISREGVSARTTGNLQLTGEYEEFGDVQEQRSVEGGNITIHGDVFGNIVSRGGDIVLSKNLMGGTATNADGAIRVQGVASGAVLQTRRGEIALARAESCIITGTRVVIGEASNCEIIAEEVVIKVAEGCAIAARKIEIVHAGPRKQNEMLLYALVPDTSKFDKKIAELQPKVQQAAREADVRKAEMDAITSQTEVRNYLTLATRVRKREVMLTPEQEPLFHKMAEAVGPLLRQVAKISLKVKAAQVQMEQAQEEVNQVQRQKSAVQRGSRCVVELLTGDVLLRTMSFVPGEAPPYDRPAKEVKAKVRTAVPGMTVLHSGPVGPINWAPYLAD